MQLRSLMRAVCGCVLFPHSSNHFLPLTQFHLALPLPAFTAEAASAE